MGTESGGEQKGGIAGAVDSTSLPSGSISKGGEEKAQSSNSNRFNMYKFKDMLHTDSKDPNVAGNGEKQKAEKYEIKHPTSYADTMLHIFRGNVGPGLLAMGDAYKNGGILFAAIMTAVLGVICIHAQHQLLNCSDSMHRRAKCDRPPNYAETVELVFATGPSRMRSMAHSMKVMVNMFLCVTQIGFCCVYVVFIANNLKTVMDEYVIAIDLSIHMIFVVIPILLVCMIKNLKYLTPLSTMANLLMALGVGVVVYEACQDLPSVESRALIAPWKQIPLYFSTAIYAYEGIGLVLPLKHEMKSPETFQKTFGVLNIGMTVVAIIFISVGFLGYLKWGEDVQGSLTLNLEQSNPLSTGVHVMIALAVLLTYPLQMYVPVDLTWPSIKERFNFRHPVAMQLVYRAALVILTFILAESIPQLSLFISLVGAISSTALSLIFPPLIDLIVQFPERKGISQVFLVVKNLIIVALGFFIFSTGTVESFTSIVAAFGQK